MAATKHAKSVKKDTKEFITTAMMQILAHENFSALTVSDVCKRAGVSRMAFYRNFNGLEQIIYEYYHPKIADIFNTIRLNADDSIKHDAQFDFFNSFGDFIILSVERGFEPIIQRIFTEEMEKFYANGNDEYWRVFISAGVYAVWRKWLIDGRKKPLKEVMDFLKKHNAAE